MRRRALFIVIHPINLLYCGIEIDSWMPSNNSFDKHKSLVEGQPIYIMQFYHYFFLESLSAKVFFSLTFIANHSIRHLCLTLFLLPGKIRKRKRQCFGGIQLKAAEYRLVVLQNYYKLQLNISKAVSFKYHFFFYAIRKCSNQPIQ